MLTDAQRTKIPNLFAMYDANGDGLLKREDMQRVFDGLMQARGWNSDSAEYKMFGDRFMSRWMRMRAMSDAKRDDAVTLDEYLSYWDYMFSQDGGYQQDVRGIGDIAFVVFDRDQDGLITLDEYRGFYRAVGLDPEYANNVYAKVGWSDERKISKDEYLQLIRDFFFSENKEAAGNLFFGPVH